MSDTILNAKNINKVYKTKVQDVWVLKDINFEIAKGEFVILFGPSGCGKSTLLHLLLGLEEITSGSANFYGVDISNSTQDSLADFRKTNIGIIYQQSNWIKSMNVLSNVAFPLLLQGVSKEQSLLRASEVIRLVGMTQWLDYKPTELSAGQQQKIALARSLITNPKVIIADEPSGNLDYKSSLELMTLFKRLRDSGKTIIMVTHSLDNLNFADRIIQILDGHILRIIKTQDYSEKEIVAMLTEKHTIESITQNQEKTTLAKRNSEKRSVNLVKATRIFIETSVSSVKSVFLLAMYLVYTALYKLFRKGRIPGLLFKIYALFSSNFMKVVSFIDKRDVGSIKYFDLIDISAKNLFAKQTRTFITIGGISIGIAFTVLLFSIGFGVEQLIITRVATLNEIRKIDVTPSVNSNIFLKDESIERFKNISGVTNVMTTINVAGKLRYKESVGDAVIYGVKRNNFDINEVKILSGSDFQQKEEDINFQQNTLSLENNEEIADLILKNESYEIDISNSISREIIVNEAVLNLYNINSGDALGKLLKVQFISTSNLLNEPLKVTSTPVDYTIVGIIEGSATPIAYVPILDLKPLGIDKYSSINVFVETRDQVLDTRKAIEALGFRTSSIIDTISEIEGLFANIRVVFAVVGLIALIVASLGMFNTLTVSLLERTREVGLMKAIGMRSNEVKDLFLTESIMMGLFGGIAGILLGFILGQLISIILTSLSLARGGEVLQLTFLPPNTAIVILVLSLCIGILTGFYPSYRATKISALDALRYE